MEQNARNGSRTQKSMEVNVLAKWQTVKDGCRPWPPDELMIRYDIQRAHGSKTENRAPESPSDAIVQTHNKEKDQGKDHLDL